RRLAALRAGGRLRPRRRSAHARPRRGEEPPGAAVLLERGTGDAAPRRYRGPPARRVAAALTACSFSRHSLSFRATTPMVTPCWIRLRLPRLRGSCGLAAVLSVWVPARAARAHSPAKYATSLYRGLVWREVGPFRGGRVTAVAGSSAQPLGSYIGGTGGGGGRPREAGRPWRRAWGRSSAAGRAG